MRFLLRIALTLTIAYATHAASSSEDASAAYDAYQASHARYLEALATSDMEIARGAEGAAREHLHKARSLLEAQDGRGVEATQLYAEVLGLLGEYDLAAEQWVHAVRLLGEDNPAALAPLAALAEAGTRAGEAWKARATAAAERVLSAEEAAPAARARALVARGDLLWDAGLYPLAREDYAAAVVLEGENPRAALRLAAAEVQAGTILEASERLDAIGAAAQQYDVEIRTRLRVALEAFERARLSLPEAAQQHAAYARLLYRAARVPEAVLALQRASRMAPENVDHLNLLGAMYLQLGNVKGAIDQYERSLKAVPEQPVVRARLDQLRAAQGASTAPPASIAAPGPTNR